MCAWIVLFIFILLWLFPHPMNLYSVWIYGKWLINWNWNQLLGEGGSCSGEQLDVWTWTAKEADLQFKTTQILDSVHLPAFKNHKNGICFGNMKVPDSVTKSVMIPKARFSLLYNMFRQLPINVQNKKCVALINYHVKM
jgi:hypothetical protein